jgi:hypothetical protein
MLIRIGCEIYFELSQDVPFISLLRYTLPPGRSVLFGSIPPGRFRVLAICYWVVLCSNVYNRLT